LDKLKKGTSHRGYYWVYHDPGSGLVLYEYNESRSQKAPTELLKDYAGYLQTDGYAVYDALPNDKIVLTGCMAHARRKFYEAKDNNEEKAVFMLDKIQLLYQVEAMAREQKLSHEQRLQLRLKLSSPVLDEMKLWMKDNIMNVTPKSPIGKAIEYTLTRWDKLCRYTEDGILEIDNNLVENAIRPIALGRKNYLFAGSHEAAKRAGIIYSFITCCKKNGYDPYKWLEETLTVLSDTKKSQLYKLLPFKKDGI
jgi:transposase